MKQEIKILNYTIEYDDSKISLEWINKLIAKFDQDIKELREINYLSDEEFIDYFYEIFDDYYGIESISFVNMNIDRGTTTLYFKQSPVVMVSHEFNNKYDEDIHRRCIEISYGLSSDDFDETRFLLNYEDKSFDEM